MLSALLALLQALPELIKLGGFIAAMMRDREQQGLGRSAALAEALTAAHEELARADAADVEAQRAHAKDSTDDAFLPDFRRSD